MSKFLKTPNDMLSRDSLQAIAGKYILEGLPRKAGVNLNQNYYLSDDGTAEVQKILDNSGHALRMYGTARELAENLKIFRNFPDMEHFFAIEMAPNTSTPVIYKSLKGEEYICKSDLFVILQNMTRSIFPGSNSEQIRLAIIIPLRAYQKKHPSKFLEFVKYDQQWFDGIEKELKEVEKLCYRHVFQVDLLEQQFRLGDFKSYIASFKAFSDLETWDAVTLERDTKKLYETNKDAHFLAYVHLKAAIMKTLQMVLENRSDVFLPSEIVPKTLRVFDVDGSRFVMKAEFFEALRMDYKDENDNFATMSMQDVEENYGDRVKSFEFIQVPILRAKHRAVPIHEPLSTVRFCIPAVDGFFDFAKTLIFGIQFFQKFKLDKLNELFKSIEYGFLAEETNLYFISMEGIEDLKRYTGVLVEKLCGIGTAKPVRNAKKDGFTVQNLKNELAHLNLLNAFPEIQNHAEVVYAEVDKMKKEPVLRTCDLFDAIEHCQLICILSRLPKYKKFLHNQKGCQRVYGYKCNLCCDSASQKNKKKRNKKKKAKKSEDSESPDGDEKEAEGSESQEQEPPKANVDDEKTSKLQKPSQVDLENELARMKQELEKKNAEIQRVQLENRKLTIQNEAHEETINKLIEKLAGGKL